MCTVIQPHVIIAASAESVLTSLMLPSDSWHLCPGWQRPQQYVKQVAADAEAMPRVAVVVVHVGALQLPHPTPQPAVVHCIVQAVIVQVPANYAPKRPTAMACMGSPCQGQRTVMQLKSVAIAVSYQLLARLIASACIAPHGSQSEKGTTGLQLASNLVHILGQ